VLHCPANVGGNPQGLARAERELGLQSWAVTFRQRTFQYPVDEVLWPKTCGRLGREWRRWKLLRRALRDFDVVHFNFGCSIGPERLSFDHSRMRAERLPTKWLYTAYSALFDLRDLAWLKRAGIGIVMTYQGDDARQGDFCREKFEISIADEVGPDYYTAGSDRNTRRRIQRVARYADRIYALNPDLLHVLPAGSEFLPYASVDCREWTPIGASADPARPPVVLHAPTHREAKGTRYILDAVEKLRKVDRIDFEFMLVENLSHAKARRLYEQADLLVDQLLAGWYGALSVELMALGKPVVCYIRRDDLKLIPAGMRAELPIITAEPQTVYHVLKQWLGQRRTGLAEVGQRSRTFVEKWHDPLTISERLKQAYEDIAGGQRRRTRQRPANTLARN